MAMKTTNYLNFQPGGGVLRCMSEEICVQKSPHRHDLTFKLARWPVVGWEQFLNPSQALIIEPFTSFEIGIGGSQIIT